MGNDLSVANAARVSFAKVSEELTSKDERLLDYLADHNHWTPFAHTAISLRMQAPIPIRTQCFKHKAGFVENEESRRYIDDTPTFFTPRSWRRRPEGSVKQGSGESFDLITNHALTSVYNRYMQECIAYYEYLVNEEHVAPEQARFVLPQGVEVQWIWTGNLASYARFYLLRKDSHAQGEVQELAGMVGRVIEPLFPHSWKALVGD